MKKKYLKSFIKRVLFSSSTASRLYSDVASISEIRSRLDFCEKYILAQKARDLLNLLKPREYEGMELVRVGSEGDGGYVMVNSFSDIDAAYSFGIANDVSWDRQIAEKSIPVFMYDHTIGGLPENHENFNFFKIGICGKPNEPGMMDIGALIRSNGHLGKNLIMKMDIEGSEYPAVNAMTEEEISCFSQIVCEVHDLNLLFSSREGHERIGEFIKKISQHMYCVHVHANNVGQVHESHGVKVPALLELSFVRKGADRDFSYASDLRTDLDSPNKKDRPDIDVSVLWQ